MGHIIHCCIVLVFPGDSQAVSPGEIVFNEFVATNQDGIVDKDGDHEDWIELVNTTGGALSLSGLYLSDASDDLLKWQFPNINLAGGDHLLIFASGKNVTDVAELHTNFKIDREGEYLALVDSASAVIDEIDPLFPPQQPGYSYGIDTVSGQLRYLEPPTPGADNSTSTAYEGFLENIVFSAQGGFYDDPFDLTLSHSDPSANIYYTIDGTTPTAALGLPYSTPIRIEDLSTVDPPVTRGPIVRAQAFRTGYVPSRIGSHTYLINMDEVVKSLPAVCVVTSWDNIEGEYGIFDSAVRSTSPVWYNVLGRGRAWERPGHAEWFSADGTVGFKADCGIRLHASDSSRGTNDPEGGTSISPLTKNSMRLYFREEYGNRDIPSDVFLPRVDVPRLERMVLRAGKNDEKNPFIIDEMVRRTFQDTGQVSGVGTFAHHFINGVLRGYYNPCERLDDDFMRDHHGGNNDWDVIRNGQVGDGDQVAWNELQNYVATHDLSDASNYQGMADRLDIGNFIDYLLVLVYTSNDDWPGGNYVAAREKVSGAKWRFYVWDAEGSMQDIGDNTFTTRLRLGSPISNIYQALKPNTTFQSLWAEKIRKHMFGNGALIPSRMRANWVEIRDLMYKAIPVLTRKFPTPWISKRWQYYQSYLLGEGFIQPLNDIEPSATSPLFINEFMALNNSGITDGSGEYADWIEIYNNSGDPVDLSGMFLTDNLDIPMKYMFPAGSTIDPFGFVVIWADNDPEQGADHADFRLSGDGEQIGLFDTLANGNALLDSVVFGPQTPDTSEGRRPDGTGSFGPLPTSSPGASNGTIPPTLEPGDYWVRANLHVGGGLNQFAIGDVDGDGHLDLVSADFNFGRVAVLLSNGPGTRTFRGPFYYPVILGTKSVALADLDGDTHPEIITINDSLVDYTVGTLPNNGDGTFGAATLYPLYSLVAGATEYTHPQAVTTADLNGDGYPDVVVSNESPQPGPNFANIFMNDGTGSGGLLPVSKLDLHRFTADSSGRNLVAADLDGDSDVDLVSVTDFRPLSGSFNQGGGVFAEAVAINGFSQSTSVAGADFDNDGDIDIASTNSSNFTFVFLNAGDGSFGFPDDYPPPWDRRPEVLTPVDIDGDGHLDLAVATTSVAAYDSPGIAIYLNNGDGTFRLEDQGVGLPSSADLILFPEAIESGDLDGDGADDLVVADSMNGNLVVFFNETETPPPAPTPTPDPLAVPEWGRY